MFNSRELSLMIQRSECLVFSHSCWGTGRRALGVYVGLGFSTLEGSQNYSYLGEDTSVFCFFVFKSKSLIVVLHSQETGTCAG